MKNEDGLLQSTLENSRWSIADNRTLAQVKMTQVSTTLGHQMPLSGGTSELRSARPNLVPVLATICLYLGVHVSSCQLDLTLYWS